MLAPAKRNAPGFRVWAEVSLSALQQNLRSIQKHIQKAAPLGRAPGVLAVVKANAYGHGAVPVAKALAQAGAQGFGVACVSEAIELRESGIRNPILLMGGYLPGEEREVVEFNITPAISNCRQLGPLNKAASRGKAKRNSAFPVQAKFNTGMNRMGLAPSDVNCLARTMADCPNLRLSATFTHFASSELLDGSQTDEQRRLFQGTLIEMHKLGLAPGSIHMANSAAIVARPETWGDMVRPGAVLYGCHVQFDPLGRQSELEAALPVKAVLSLRTKIVGIRDVAAGEAVGYDGRFITNRPTRLAVIAAGYADGLMRGLSNQGTVLVLGRRAPIVGQISMDMAMVDVTGIAGVALGETVTIIGEDGGRSQSAGEVASVVNTVVQDVLCALGSRVHRIYLKN